MRIIAQNSGEIAEKRSMLIEKKEAENRTFQLKNVAVLLSRADEMRRIQDYYNSLSN